MELEERLASETAWLSEQTEMANSTQPGRDLATNSAALIVLQARAAPLNTLIRLLSVV